MKTKPACDCLAYRRSDCRAGAACGALRERTPAPLLFNSTRPAWVAGRWIIAAGLAAGLAVLGLALGGCCATQCRDSTTGRFVACPPPAEMDAWDAIDREEKRNAAYDERYLRRHGHGYPVGADYDKRTGEFRCRDAAGRTWPSRGECD